MICISIRGFPSTLKERYSVMKKLLAMLLICAMALGMSGIASAETNDLSLMPGTTVIEDASSPTGYTVTFTFESAEAGSVQLDVGANYYAKPNYEAGWSDQLMLGTQPETVVSPYEWTSDLIGEGYEGCIIDLEKVEGTDLWTVSLPLAHGLIQYNYVVDGVQTDDPTNPPMVNPNENGGRDGDSTVYVPLNAEKQPNATDFSYLNAETVTEPGTLEYVTYTDINGNIANLGIYTPYGFDTQREEPYKVVYVSHGGGANEVNWFGCGRMNIEYDHMIQNGEIEPCVVVTMNNAALDWDYAVIVDNLKNCIFPLMEKNYNVSSEPANRAFCGLSMGGKTTSNVLHACPNDFDYFGIFSGGDSTLDFTTVEFEGEQPSIMVGAGCYDFGYMRGGAGTPADTFSNVSLAIKFGAAGIKYDWKIVDGGHDWYTWPELMHIFATEYLWK